MNNLNEARSEFKLKSPPEDAISAVKFVPGNSPLLLVSSWDSTVGLYDINANQLKHRYTHNHRPVLDCAIKDASSVFSGGLDESLVSYDFRSETATACGKHDAPIRCVEYNHDRQVVVTGSWDSSVKIWDTRSRVNLAETASTQDEVYTLSTKEEMLIVGTAGRKILVFDLRNLESPLQTRDSLLKYQTRCLRIFPNKQGFVLSSIEGRVSVEYFDPSPEVQKKKYAFKCHRIKEAGMEAIYPVNAISFHEDHSTFATGGSDGFVNIWDGFNKKRLCQFHRYPTGIASLAFNTSGSVLAIACSHLHETEELPNPMPEDVVFIRSVTDQETKPK